MQSFVKHLEELPRYDDCQRLIPSDCFVMALELAALLEQDGVSLPLPLPCGDPDESPCVYLQWKRAGAYIYEDGINYLDGSCHANVLQGDRQERFREVCRRAREDNVTGYY